MPKIYGVEYEEIFDGNYIIWRAFIRNPFWWGGKLEIGLNEKFIRQAQIQGVNKILLVVGQREIPFNVPTDKAIKQKIKAGEYEDKPSLFAGYPPYKIFHFAI